MMKALVSIGIVSAAIVAKNIVSLVAAGKTFLKLIIVPAAVNMSYNY